MRSVPRVAISAQYPARPPSDSAHLGAVKRHQFADSVELYKKVKKWLLNHGIDMCPFVSGNMAEQPGIEYFMEGEAK